MGAIGDTDRQTGLAWVVWFQWTATGRSKVLLKSRIFSIASSNELTAKYLGWKVVIGYSVSATVLGTNSATSGCSLKQYSSSPNDDSRPAPYACVGPARR